jgi:hypothetical protein
MVRPVRLEGETARRAGASLMLENVGMAIMAELPCDWTCSAAGLQRDWQKVRLRGCSAVQQPRRLSGDRLAPSTVSKRAINDEGIQSLKFRVPVF